MSNRNLWVMGGTSGIGEVVHDRLRYSMKFHETRAFGLEDFNIIRRSPMRQAAVNLLPTDLVYSVGINRLDWIPEIKYGDFQEVMDANVYGILNLLRVLDEEGAGPLNMVVITSDAAWRPMRTSAVYCASKAAAEMVVRVASREYAPRGWRINAVAPGKVEDTEMTRYVDAKVLELRGWTNIGAEDYERQSTPLGRKVTKDEVAEVVESVLFGPKAMTGEIVAVNGGR